MLRASFLKTLKGQIKIFPFFLMINSSGGLAADNSLIVGQWSLEMSIQGETLSIDLIITEDRNGLGGTWVGPEITDAVTDGNFVESMAGQQLANALANGNLGTGLLGQQLITALSGGDASASLSVQQIADALSGGSFQGAASGDQQVTNALSDVNFDGETLAFLRLTQQGPLEVSLKLEDNTLSGSLTAQQGTIPVFGRKIYIPTDEWPAPYNGVTPDLSFGLAFNNIGVFRSSESMINTCVRIFTGGLPSSVGGISEFDINLIAVSLAEATFQITQSREFNSFAALNENAEYPECSGKFETTTNTYTDLIEADEGFFATTWDLIDPSKLILQLRSYEEIKFN